MATVSVVSKLTARCEMCPSRSSGVCCGLSDGELEHLCGLMRHRRLQAGEQVIHQDDVSDVFAIIISGTVKLTRVLPDGREQIVGLLGPADCLGDLFLEGASHNTAECVTNTVLCCFPRDRFETYLRDHQDLERRLLTLAMRDLDEARDWLVTLGRKNASEKVATFLLWLLEKQQTTKASPFAASAATLELPLSRQEIGDFLGLTVETVSRQMTKLRAAGAIRLNTNHQIAIDDVDKLRRIAEQSSV